MKKSVSSICVVFLCLWLTSCMLPNTEVQDITDTTETSEAFSTTTTTLEETTTAPPPENISPEWVRTLPEANDDQTTQILIIAADGMDETTATVSLHEKDENGYWVQILETPAYVGKSGMISDEDRYEGCGKTPIGRYHFTKAFGIADDPGSVMPYTKVTDDLYWSGDYDIQYNQMVSINDYPGLDTSNSEHLIDYTTPYQYCLNIGFNEDGTAGRGSAIFLHCYGAHAYTAGCVAVPEEVMVEILQKVDEGCVVVIDLGTTLGI